MRLLLLLLQEQEKTPIRTLTDQAAAAAVSAQLAVFPFSFFLCSPFSVIVCSGDAIAVAGVVVVVVSFVLPSIDSACSIEELRAPLFQ